jgi:hypothetical protein
MQFEVQGCEALEMSTKKELKIIVGLQILRDGTLRSCHFCPYPQSLKTKLLFHFVDCLSYSRLKMLQLLWCWCCIDLLFLQLHNIES